MVFLEDSELYFYSFFRSIGLYSFSLVLHCVFLLYYQFLEAFACLYIFFLAFTARAGPCSINSQPSCTLQLPFTYR